jgi:hypothetical protein
LWLTVNRVCLQPFAYVKEAFSSVISRLFCLLSAATFIHLIITKMSTFDAETAGNFEEIEMQFAVKTVEHLEVSHSKRLLPSPS